MANFYLLCSFIGNISDGKLLSECNKGSQANRMYNRCSKACCFFYILLIPSMLSFIPKNRRVLKLFNHLVVNNTGSITSPSAIIFLRIQEFLPLLSEITVATEVNMNLSSFFFVKLGNQSFVLSGRRCSLKWAMGSF